MGNFLFCRLVPGERVNRLTENCGETAVNRKITMETGETFSLARDLSLRVYGRCFRKGGRGAWIQRFLGSSQEDNKKREQK
ncbi:hypothetical protein [Desulfobacula phenolica]|nr:hypothetical protein [Desulfobacula phenolica]